MNLDKSKKRIAKKVKMGFHGYPAIELEYFANRAGIASEVAVRFVADEGAGVQEQRFTSKGDAREDEAIQSAIVKMIERAEAKTVTQKADLSIIG